MEITETKNEGLKREFKITLPSGDINQQADERLAEIQRNFKQPGFRPGKVPIDLIRKKHMGAVRGEVVEEMVANSMRKLLVDRNLQPALKPDVSLGNYEADGDIEYNLAFEIFPEMPDVDLESLKLKKSNIVTEDKDVQDGLDRMINMAKEYEAPEKDRAAKKDDKLMIDFDGSVDGAPFDGGSSKGFELVLGSKQFIEGFEDQLIGKKKGDEVTVKVTFPEPYFSEDLAGKDAEFKVVIHDVLESKELELDEEFAKKFGAENVDDLREKVKERLIVDAEPIAKMKMKKELFDILDEQVTIEVPEGMVKLELDSLKMQQQTGMKPEEKTDDDELGDIAIRRVKLGILLADMAKKNTITVTQDELRDAVFEHARSMPGQEQKVIEFYQGNQDALEQLKGPILEEKVVDYIFSKFEETEDITIRELLDFESED